MVAGEAPLDTAVRKLSEEAGLVGVERDRCHYVGVYSTCFAHRSQEPVGHGSHTVNLVFQVELTPAEVEKVSLNEEYAPGWQWVDYGKVGQQVATTVMDRALLTIVGDLHK